MQMPRGIRRYCILYKTEKQMEWDHTDSLKDNKAEISKMFQGFVLELDFSWTLETQYMPTNEPTWRAGD